MSDHVLTLIAGAAAPLLDEAVVMETRDRLRVLGADVGRVEWLAPAVACDIVFGHLHADQAEAVARQVLDDLPVDVIAQPAEGRRKRLLLADMESTLIDNEMLDELADFVGLRAQIAGITARAMNGELDFEGALDARVALLKGLGTEVLEQAAERITFMPGARALVQTMRAQGALTVLVSGGFTFYTAKVRATLGLDRDYANTLEIADGRLTGRVRRPILGKQAKYDTLVRLAAELGLPLAATLAVGDGANDLAMILAAGLGIAYRAKPSVAAAAKWRIDHGDLTALLYAQGYRAAEIVAF
jgi:phosphoserine phosphatase